MAFPVLFLAMVFCLLGLSPARAGPMVWEGQEPWRWEANRPNAGSGSDAGAVEIFRTVNTVLWQARLRPPEDGRALLLTVVFKESQGGFARLMWKNATEAITLCGNLYEGAAPWHQRSFLIAPNTLSGPGRLLIESTGDSSVVEKADLAWVSPAIYATASTPALFLSDSGRVIPAEELGVAGRKIPSDVVRGRTVDAVLDPGPIHLDAGQTVRLFASIGGIPGCARLDVEVAGLPSIFRPKVEINGQPLDEVNLEIPGLEDPGYIRLPGSDEGLFAGWRKVTAYVPSGFLKPGENRLDWTNPDFRNGHTLRRARLQILFEDGSSRFSPPVPSAPPPPVSVGRPDFRLGLSSRGTGVELRSE